MGHRGIVKLRSSSLSIDHRVSEDPTHRNAWGFERLKSNFVLARRIVMEASDRQESTIGVGPVHHFADLGLLQVPLQPAETYGGSSS